MNRTVHVVLAPLQLEPGVDEARLPEASEAFREPDPAMPDMGVLGFPHLKTYE